LGSDGGVDPRGEVGIHQSGEPDDGLAREVAVALEVVAGQHGERRNAGVAALSEALDDVRERGAGIVEVPDVVHDGGVVVVELACRGFFRYPPSVTVRLTMRTAVSRRAWIDAESSGPYRYSRAGDDPRLERAIRMPNDQSEQAVLGVHDVAHQEVLRHDPTPQMPQSSP
jgi:hypothetical protein